MSQPSAPSSSLLKWFRAVAFAEGVSFLVLLLVAMPLKYLAGFPMAVSVVGMLHGLLFIAYAYLAMQLFTALDWPVSRIPGVILAAVLPGGTFVLERRWLREPTLTA